MDAHVKFVFSISLLFAFWPPQSLPMSESLSLFVLEASNRLLTPHFAHMWPSLSIHTHGVCLLAINSIEAEAELKLVAKMEVMIYITNAAASLPCACGRFLPAPAAQRIHNKKSNHHSHPLFTSLYTHIPHQFLNRLR